MGELTDEEQAMIAAAWKTHRDVLNLAGTQPSDRPKTLLDGFGEATDQVVALRAALEDARQTLSYVCQHAPGYDWNADPLSLTLRTGDTFTLIDKTLSAARPEIA